MQLTWQILSDVSAAKHVLLVGRKHVLLSNAMLQRLPKEAQTLFQAMLAEVQTKDSTVCASTWYEHNGVTKRVIAGVLPEECSRHNCSARPHGITAALREHMPKSETLHVVFALEQASDCFAAGIAAARAYPEYSKKSSVDATTPPAQIIGSFWAEKGEVSQQQLQQVEIAAQSVRKTMLLVDTPASEMYTDVLLEKAVSEAKALGCETTVISGEALKEQGLGGLYNVGKAAKYKPALVVLKHEPANASKNIVWVGKGLVYDTGGLSLKSSDHMPGMKGDMGGAAAVLNAFTAAVKQKFQHNLYAVLCIAENAIGPDAMRPDDVITLYSGKSVEVNNTDAEGRLVLGDGLAYAVKHLKPDVIVDMATLTGAQMVATGKRHAAIVSNDADLEAKAVAAGLESGDLVHPIPYCPEFFRSEFKSEVADLKNSVKDKMNAPSSCAGQFLAEHLGTYKGPWLHVDIAGPSGLSDRATGFGVGLLLKLFA